MKRMRLELLPIIFGAIVALAGLGLIADAWLPDRDVLHPRERRRRARAERNRAGEALVGLAVILIGAALIGRDGWTLTPWLAGAACVLIVLGALMNRRYIGEQLNFRGAARRDPTTQVKPGMPEQTPPAGRSRIR
jgi:protein-S-isoprenylcysteine O-methyltransferase Ste14